ncbi:DUF192 domain-containing protein [bacterium]|nr:DUF192 domain-containing protein [bacterium]
MNKLLKILLSLVATGGVFYEINSRFNFVKIAIVDNPYDVKEEKEEDSTQNNPTITDTEPLIDTMEEKTDNYVSIYNQAGKLVNVSVEIAKEQAAKEKGLANRRYLGTYSGLLYVYEQNALYPFQIKDSLLYLDILFIDDNGTIVDIKQNVSPCVQNTCEDIKVDKMYKYILEVNGNFCKENDIIIGNSITFHLK